MPGASWLVYILRCADGTFYTGVTNDLERRLAAHASGKASRYTRCRLPVCVAYAERVGGRGAALRREWTIKKLTRARKLALVTRYQRAG
jgi:putative endonuclease